MAGGDSPLRVGQPASITIWSPPDPGEICPNHPPVELIDLVTDVEFDDDCSD